MLIPQFETEELVANVLIAYDETFPGQVARLVDVGTGSGCLAIALQTRRTPSSSSPPPTSPKAALETAQA
ncbi:MAG: hypothetical protein MZU97_23210 [Bacillus subtilis]|nr:hypothetical protein [Bacillus subtilis]